MKTAISIPNSIFQAAERMAQKLGVSRSELFTKAVSEYIATHQSQETTATLNRIYEETTPDIDKALQTMQARSLPKEDW